MRNIFSTQNSRMIAACVSWVGLAFICCGYSIGFGVAAKVFGGTAILMGLLATTAAWIESGVID